jgi:hypothetical protein
VWRAEIIKFGVLVAAGAAAERHQVIIIRLKIRRHLENTLTLLLHCQYYEENGRIQEFKISLFLLLCVLCVVVFDLLSDARGQNISTHYSHPAVMSRLTSLIRSSILPLAAFQFHVSSQCGSTVMTTSLLGKQSRAFCNTTKKISPQDEVELLQTYSMMKDRLQEIERLAGISALMSW